MLGEGAEARLRLWGGGLAREVCMRWVRRKGQGEVNVCFKKSKTASHLGLPGHLVPLGEIVTWPSGRSALWDSRRSPVQRWEAVSSPGLALSRTPPWWGQVAEVPRPRCSGTGCGSGSGSRLPRLHWTERRCASGTGASCRTRPLWEEKRNR